MTKRKASNKGAGGRPTQYRAHFAAQAKKLCVLGATDRELGDFFQVDEATIYRWRLSHPEFCRSMKTGKGAADDRVERALYQRALGGDVTAQIFWLKNRRSKSWRDFKAVELATPPGRPLDIAMVDDKGAAWQTYLDRLESIAADRRGAEPAKRPTSGDQFADIEKRFEDLDQPAPKEEP